MKRLTPKEQEIMRVVWSQKGDIAEIELKTYMHTKKDTEYARTTLATFLMKIEEKGYISKYRRGRNSYVHAEIPVDEYVKEELGLMLTRFCRDDKEHFQDLVDEVLK